MSFSKYKFLLDENVRSELYQFLREKKADVKTAPKGSSDSTLARLSSQEKRVFVTNDQDFTEYAKTEVFSVVWLRIPQADSAALLNSFEEMLKDSPVLKGSLVVLYPEKFDTFPLGDIIEYK